MWNERYGAADYAYGTEPNRFFRSVLDELEPGRLLLPADGEGRNGVYAATRGWRVHSFDPSEAGRDKAMELATSCGVDLRFDIATFDSATVDADGYDAVAFVFAHMHESARTGVHRRFAAALRPGGHVILEAYSYEQLDYGTGGPPGTEMLYTVDHARRDFAGDDMERPLQIVSLERVVDDVTEGKYHTGRASVIRLVARAS